MSDSPGPTRTQGDLAQMLETLLDKGMVINADIAVTVGDTELLGVQLRAAVASFETAEEYGLAFPSDSGFTAPEGDSPTDHGATAPLPQATEDDHDDG